MNLKDKSDNKIENLEYARRLHDNVLNWYTSADSKAQVVLGIDGGFIAFVSSTVFKKPDELRTVLGSFTFIMWLILGLMIFSLLVSIGASIYCLWSRIYSERKIREIIREATEKASSEDQISERYPPSVALFFQFIERLDEKKFKKTLESVDRQFEIEVLTREIHILSGNVRKKHFAVNVGFLLAAFALWLFILLAASYTLTVL